MLKPGRAPVRLDWTPAERAFVGRVMSRLKMKPIYMQLKIVGAIWGVSLPLASRLINEARS